MPHDGAIDRTTDLQQQLSPRVPAVSEGSSATSDALTVIPDGPESTLVEWPWSQAAATRRRVRAATLEASHGIAEDRLAAARRIQATWNELACVRAAEAARTAVLEARADGEAARLSLAFRRLVQMTTTFSTELSALEPFRAALGDEILDAIRERALNEFAARVAAAMRGDSATARRQP